MEENNLENFMGNNIMAHNLDEYFNSLPCGFRFCPTDVELVSCYLMKKVLKLPLPFNRFRTIDIYQFHPNDLIDNFRLIRESEWYFFSSRDRKYPNGRRPSREAKDGYWKATGRAEDIEFNGEVVGSKRTLDFYNGTHKESKRSVYWKMHEYRLDEKIASSNKIGNGNMKLDDCVLCKIYIKKSSDKDKNNDNIIAESATQSDQALVPVTTTNVTSHVCPVQSIQLDHRQHQTPLVYHDQSSTTPTSNANRRHRGMPTSTILTNNDVGYPNNVVRNPNNDVGNSNTDVGIPRYYDPYLSFQKEMDGYYPEPTNNFNHPNCSFYDQHSSQNEAFPYYPEPINNFNHQDCTLRESSSSQFPWPDSKENFTGSATVNDHQIPLFDTDTSSIELPQHVREYERSLKAGGGDGQRR